MVGSVVVAEDRFSRAEVGGGGKWGAIVEDGVGSERSVRGLGHKGGYLVAAKGAQERVLVVNYLGSLSKGAEVDDMPTCTYDQARWKASLVSSKSTRLHG